MKSSIIYYSYSGNTRKVASVLAEYLGYKGQARTIELISPDESKSFFGQCRRAFSHARANLQEVEFNLSDSDLICLGSPVWAFGPAPAMNTYLDKCLGLQGKQIILFTTYGSGTGNQRCLDYMQAILTKKGALNFKKFSVPQNKVQNKEFVLSKINDILKDV